MSPHATAVPRDFFGRTRFLVVDDFESMQKLTANQLRQLGADKVVVAKNGVEALKVLRSQPIDFVLSDWNMPLMDGLELLKAIRADGDLGSLPVVMITAEAERTRVEAAVASGVSGMLLKPYTPELLLQKITKASTHKPRKAVSAASADAGRSTTGQPGTPVAAQARNRPTGEAQRPTILVVDDTPDNLNLLSNLLKDEFRVRLANSGAKALEACFSDSPPDLVLLDIMMPEMDGFEVAKRLQEHPSAESIPVIFVSAMSSVDDRIKGLNLGAVDYVVKPVDPDVLLPRVRNFVRFVQMRKSLQLDYDEMVEAAQLRDDVDQITRHDLKGPLAGVLGLVQNLMSQGQPTPEQIEQLKLVEETTLQVLNMINLSAELFKIESGRFTLTPAPIDLDNIIRRIAEINGAAYDSKQIDVTIEQDPPSDAPWPKAHGDAMLCYSLFQNLIKNAFEAAPPETQIRVILRAGDPLSVTLVNKGAVPTEIRGRFFDKYVTAGKKGGTGLGTYSAKLLCQAQNGRIELSVDDESNTTSVTVSLPCTRETNASGGGS